MIFDYANNYVTYVRNAITTVAGDDVEIQMVDAQNDQAKQVEQVDLMINKGARVLCVNAIDPTGNYVLVGNQDSDEIVVFAIDPNGHMKQVSRFATGSPVCIRFF